MKIFTTDELRDIDRYTIEEEGVSAEELVARVGHGVAEVIISRYLPTKPIAVFAGPGNNGADALSTATVLLQQGYSPEIYLFNIGGDKLSDACRRQRDSLLETPGVKLFEVIHDFSLPELNHNWLVVDGLFGIGLREPLSGGFISLVRYINDSRATVLSIDIPSGMTSEWNANSIHRNIIHANITVTIEYPRLAFFLKENAPLVGDWQVINVGLSQKAAANILPTYYLIERDDVKRKLRRRNNFCSKADLGSVALVAGSYGMMGAAVLAARGAVRSGVGKVTVFAPKCGFTIMQSAVPEAMFVADRDSMVVSDISLKQNYSAIALGPGLGTNTSTVEALEEFLSKAKNPVILDADALNCLSQQPALLNSIPVLSILTPHPGEFDRLFGPQTSDEARLKKAVEMAHYYNVFIVLKGHYTVIARPDGKVYFNSSGSTALATAGSGDVLTGIIASFLAQGYYPEIAAMIGVFVHGLAGEMAEAVHGTYGTTSSDIAANVGKAIQAIMEE